MTKTPQHKRLILLALAIVAAFLGLGYRLVDLQITDHPELERRAQDNTERTLTKHSRRGDIRSANGDLLATSIPAWTICADPSLLAGRHLEFARALAPHLKLDPAQLADRLQPRIRRYETNDQGAPVPIPVQYTELKHEVPLEEWAQIQAALAHATFGLNPASTNKAERQLLATLRTRVLQTKQDEIRVYPNGHLASQVIGYTQDDDKTRVPVGRDGIEWNYNDALTGVNGWRETERDHDGHELVLYRRQDVQPRDGNTVFLTIDTLLQQVVETELADAMDKFRPKSITGIIVRPRTGDILALANLPNYDPNLPGAFHDDSRRNRVIADIVEPGSTFKIVVIAGALNEGLLKLDDVIDCEHGLFKYGGTPLRDHDGGFGPLTLEHIITKSSNIGAAKVGILLGPRLLYHYATAFGFGARTGIPLAGEQPGISHPPAAWSKLSIARIPMGHGIAVTRLQMLMAMAAIANDGLLMRPQLVDRIQAPDGRVLSRTTPQPVRQVITPATARLMVQALKTVTTKDGTAPRAALDHYTTAGKTGTAQKVKTQAEGGGYSEDRYISSFVGFLPADHPELCISIVLDEPPYGQHFGGVCAAPVFRRIAERAASYFNMKPDLGEAAVLPAMTAAEGSTNSAPVAARR